MFVSIDLEPLQMLRMEFVSRGAPIRDGWWGYDTMIVEDPDGNELFFPYPGTGRTAKAAPEGDRPLGGSASLGM